MKIMTGIEVVEFMNNGGKVCLSSKKDVIYGISNGFICIVDERGCFVEDTLFNLRLEYEEYIEPKVTGWERLSYGSDVFYSNYSGCVLEFKDRNIKLDDEMYECANYFSTKEKAEEINFKQILFRKLQRFSDENGGNEIDWNDGSTKKFYIAYKGGKLFIDWMSETKYFGQIYFVSREVAVKAIELFHDDLVKYFTM